mgnify:FL=1
MLFNFLKPSLLFLSFCLLIIRPAFGVSCPDYNVLEDLPSFSMPDDSGFRKSRNTWLSWLYQPYHFIHDQMVNPDQETFVVGKFDYDWLLHKDLEGEYIKAYIYGTGMNDWEYLGQYKTDSDGKVFVPVNKGVGEYKIRMVVTGDLSMADGFVSVVDSRREAVLFDIDGTLTLNDFEAVGDYLGTDVADAYYYAQQTVNAYKDKGYQIIYLTGRPYWVGKDTREWFDYMELPLGHLHTNPYGDGPIPPDTQAYKSQYLNQLINENNIKIVRAYGNASTDIAAYESAGIDKAQTFIIGENAGNNNTQAIWDDYVLHFSDVVMNTPTANCSQ